MKSFVKICSLLIASLIILSGCAQDKQPPTPADTALGAPTRPAGGSPGWIDGDIYDQAGAGGSYSEGDLPDGLEMRGSGPGGSMNAGDGTILETVYFGFDEFSIRPAERSKVEAAADYLNNNPGSRLIAEGHTDWKGTTQYNLGLGDRRANAVKTYLVQLGVNPDRVEVLALGELEADQGLDKEHPDVIDDRKVELIVLGN